ncbi:isoamylase early set domain-containing protein [Acidiferrimicrobium sp. IK]|uniref:isoamylase early set domain-containing protein n=1 Tax=Acidiferrimicrobium sp. IK TaxID=2871700 RepID=UPI0021CB48AD|nr:isoamylase early set domain-containing protein [Acidiferrimicrobium sp. IK]MCU4185885.1 isoamylase early set domain-containing protein [Acidiferrimicrobium sp. IK]
MARKTYSKGGRTARVTFELPAEVDAETATLVGDFNEWSPDATPLVKRKDGRFSVTLTLATERCYRYRYLLDGARWENDWQADAYVANDHGSEDSILSL